MAVCVGQPVVVFGTLRIGTPSMLRRSVVSSFIPPASVAHWFKADAITAADNDPVTTWPDSSANARDATQAVAGAKPTFKTAIVNGKPVVRFDGGDRLATPSWAAGVAVTHIAVVKLDAAGNTPFVVDRLGAGALFFDSTTRRPSASGPGVVATLVAAVTLGDWHVLNGSFDAVSNAVSIRQDGGTAVTGVDVGVPTQTVATLIGGRADGSLPFTGDIAEALTFNGLLSAPDRVAVEQYLGAKYGITVA